MLRRRVRRGRGDHATQEVRHPGVSTPPEQEVLHLGVVEMVRHRNDLVQLPHPPQGCLAHVTDGADGDPEDLNALSAHTPIGRRTR
eukprot:8389013-Pyramimonas_sp.AAC.1